MIKRYEIDCPRCGIDTSAEPDGEWVAYDDHDAELTALREQLATAEKRAEAAEAVLRECFAINTTEPGHCLFSRSWEPMTPETRRTLLDVLRLPAIKEARQS